MIGRIRWDEIVESIYVQLMDTLDRGEEKRREGKGQEMFQGQDDEGEKKSEFIAQILMRMLRLISFLGLAS